MGNVLGLATLGPASPPPTVALFSVAPTAAGVTGVQIATLVVAALAVVSTVVSAILLRRTGKGTVAASERAAAASERSAKAAENSAEAAQSAVGVNRETAIGVAQRAHADGLAGRYQDAANQLGHAKASVRLAGVYAMARLADDWAAHRQECVDVLCAYLRMPAAEVAGAESEGSEAEVRRAILSIIIARVSGDAPWKSLNFNFRHTEFRDVDFLDAQFENCSFQGATFVGDCVFANVAFSGDVGFTGISVKSGSLTFLGVTSFSRFHMDNLVIDAGAEIAFDGLAKGPHSFIDFSYATIKGRLDIRLRRHASDMAVVARDVKLTGDVLVGDIRRISAWSGPIETSAELLFENWVFGPSALVLVAREIREKVRIRPRSVWDSGHVEEA
jgi:hypothetical protein